jgi:hypothetical protein
MKRTYTIALTLVLGAFGMVGCSKPAPGPAGKAESKSAPPAKTVEKAAKPSPYKLKVPRQLTGIRKESAPRISSVPAKDESSQSE